MPNVRLVTRNSCDHPLTSEDIRNNHLCGPIHKCIHCQTWFQGTLVAIIFVILVGTCLCVKKFCRKKPQGAGISGRKSSYGRPSRIDRAGGGGGRRTDIPPMLYQSPGRVWPGMEKGMIAEIPQRSRSVERREGSMPLNAVPAAPARSHSAWGRGRGSEGFGDPYATRQ
ncbi:MAG: hypothetical protein L6R39_003480 [Caloplaca ligustica]|nr:MAG: hypothetical protein L6R39_003480 [Caloplaca ligustica]